ncbi:hypothetical protein Scep_026411 [Stephania cephalantha]|uniref:DUF4283 domain-containing protein n=1 Tax=Stephania cephalantha TaxID=152367 RepID=A0AAP0EN96_9MAGN
MDIIDIGEEHFVAKFEREEDFIRALTEGPWMVINHYVAVSRWVPNFVPGEITISTTQVSVRLPKLPLEYYNEKRLERAGNVLGKFVKADFQTTMAARVDCGNSVLDKLLAECLVPVEKGDGNTISFYKEVSALQTQPHPPCHPPQGPNQKDPDGYSFGPWMIAQRRQRAKPRRQTTQTGFLKTNMDIHANRFEALQCDYTFMHRQGDITDERAQQRQVPNRVLSPAQATTSNRTLPCRRGPQQKAKKVVEKEGVGQLLSVSKQASIALRRPLPPGNRNSPKQKEQQAGPSRTCGLTPQQAHIQLSRQQPTGGADPIQARPTAQVPQSSCTIRLGQPYDTSSRDSTHPPEPGCINMNVDLLPTPDPGDTDPPDPGDHMVEYGTESCTGLEDMEAMEPFVTTMVEDTPIEVFADMDTGRATLYASTSS